MPAVVVGGIGSLVVTGLAAVFFPALRRADALTAESLAGDELQLSIVWSGRHWLGMGRKREENGSMKGKERRATLLMLLAGGWD